MKKNLARACALIAAAALMLTMLCGCTGILAAFATEESAGIAFDPIVCQYESAPIFGYAYECIPTKYTVYADNSIAVSVGPYEATAWYYSDEPFAVEEKEIARYSITEEQKQSVIDAVRKNKLWNLADCSNRTILDGSCRYISLYDAQGSVAHTLGGVNPTNRRFDEVSTLVYSLIPDREEISRLRNEYCESIAAAEQAYITELESLTNEEKYAVTPTAEESALGISYFPIVCNYQLAPPSDCRSEDWTEVVYSVSHDRINISVVRYSSKTGKCLHEEYSSCSIDEEERLRLIELIRENKVWNIGSSVAENSTGSPDTVAEYIDLFGATDSSGGCPRVCYAGAIAPCEDKRLRAVADYITSLVPDGMVEEMRARCENH